MASARKLNERSRNVDEKKQQGQEIEELRSPGVEKWKTRASTSVGGGCPKGDYEIWRQTGSNVKEHLLKIGKRY